MPDGTWLCRLSGCHLNGQSVWRFLLVCCAVLSRLWTGYDNVISRRDTMKFRWKILTIKEARKSLTRTDR